MHIPKEEGDGRKDEPDMMMERGMSCKKTNIKKNDYNTLKGCYYDMKGISLI